jgi:PKD repeat protein
MNALCRQVSTFAILISGCLLAAGLPSTASGQHHVLGRMEPYKNCRLCHGDTLQGLIGRSCYTCHDRVWPGGEIPPVADPGGPYAALATEQVQFNGSNSVDPDGAILEYLWDFGDGDVGEGVRPTHVYQSEGTYTVSLTVIDDLGLTDVATTEAVIGAAPNQPPVAVPGQQYTGSTGRPVQFDGSESYDPDGEIVSYAWDFGDGETGEGVEPTHTYTDLGIYFVSLTVTDDEGATGTARTTVVITPSSGGAPDIDPGGPYTGVVGQPVQFDASGTTDPDGDVLTFVWNFGDGTLPNPPSQDPTATHVYTAAGTYTARVIVFDNSDFPNFENVTVEITEDNGGGLPPVVTGDTWLVRIGMSPLEMIVSFRTAEEGLLLVETTYEDGSTSMGMGMRYQDVILWLDAAGVVYFGNVDEAAGTMLGMVYDATLGVTAFAAERISTD